MKNRPEKPLSFRNKVEDAFDSALEIFSPAVAFKRRYFRFVSRMMFNAYRGAEGGRLRGSWIPGGGSADEDLLKDLPKLREKSRDLVRNDGIASGAISTIVTNIIGTGIRPQSRIDKELLKINEDYADQLQRMIEKIWATWVMNADAGGRMNFYEMEELSERQRFVNGEAVIVPLNVTDKKRKYVLALQMIESDRLDTPTDLSANKDVRKGVEIGKYGEPLAYWVRKTHPGDYSYGRNYGNNESKNYNRYPARRDDEMVNFFHLYHLLRPGQTRGEPFMAPVINLFKDRADYMEAELVAARISACFAIFIKKEKAVEEALRYSKVSEEDSTKREEELSPGMIERLNLGEDISTFNPSRPSATFDPFMVRILRDISSGLNIPYEILAKDFSESNYSNLRGALLEARRFFMMQQTFVADHLGQPCLELLLEEAYLKGELPILDFYFNRGAYVKARWICPGWQWVDPENEITASIDAVNNNLSSLAEEAASQGYDWEEMLEQRAREKKRIKDLENKYGVSLKPEGIIPKAQDKNKPENKPSEKPDDKKQPEEN